MGNEKEDNWSASINKDEAVEMGIERYMRSLGFTQFEKHKSGIYWLNTFCSAYDKLCNFVGCWIGSNQYSRETDALGDSVVWNEDQKRYVGGLIVGYDGARREQTKVKRMVDRMRRTGHLGTEFLHHENILKYYTGSVIYMNYITVEEKLIHT